MKIAGHCLRHEEEIACKLVLWEPTERRRRRGRKALSYIDALLDDSGMDNVLELKTAMMDRLGWRRRVLDVGRPGRTA